MPAIVIIGAGGPDGLGGALARRFAIENKHVFVAGRNLQKLTATCAQIKQNGCIATPVTADATDAEHIAELFDRTKRTAAIEAVIYNAGNNAVIPFEEAALRALTQSLLREYGPQGIHVAYIIIDGVINGERAKTHFPDHLENLGNDGALSPDDIAESYWFVHTQPRTVWTHEMDLRPFKEHW